jgi:hypothetical protein
MKTIFAILVALVLVSRVASADLANNEAIHAHVDELLPPAAVAALAAPAREALLATRWSLSLGALIPIYGSYALDHKVYGGIRPAAIAFDWILGGVAPAGLGVAALATDGHTRSILAWTALGLYASTRIGVLVIGNFHITEYNRYVKLRLGLAEAPGGQAAPALFALTSW